MDICHLSINRVQADLYLNNLVAQALELTEATQEGCRSAGEPEMFLFLKQFNSLMRDTWEITETLSEPHCSLAFALFTISEVYLSVENYPSLKHLTPTQLDAIIDPLMLLKCKDLTMAQVGKADFQMMQAGIQTSFPLYVDGDLNALYEAEKYVYTTNLRHFQPICELLGKSIYHP